MDLTGKVAIVTGAGRGIGRAISIGLANNGCKVILAARTESQLKEVEKEISSNGGQAAGVPIDLSQKGSCRLLVESALDHYGSLDVLINNAAVFFATGYLEITEEEWDRVMDINLKAPFLLSQAALKVMKKNRSGYIINISSTAALQVPVSLTTYGTSQKGLID